MITPTSTNPATTQNRPFVFRSCFLDDFQGEVMAKCFKKSFEEEQGEGSVIAFMSFESDPSDLSPQLAKIVASDAEVLFVPQYAVELPGILKQIRDAGWDKPIMGGDTWEFSDLMETCGDLCKGLFFSSHFSSYGAEGTALAFVKDYEKNRITPYSFCCTWRRCSQSPADSNLSA